MNLKTELMPHQVPAVEKVLPSRIGALFMQMGLGKSRTAIELTFRRWSKIDRVVWFCPVSLKETVRQEIIKHTDSTDILVFDGKINECSLPKAFWYIIGIESMSASTRMVLAANKLVTSKTMVILDESSYIKGHYAKRTLRITKIAERARYRLILTGTPISQGVVDLFSQMRFLSPKILGYDSFYSFAANHLEYSEKFPGMIVRAHNTEYLAAKIAPYVYQVTKEECLDLPTKIYTTRYFGMVYEQSRAYEEAKNEILGELEREEFDTTVIFRLFGVLQQIACGFWHRRVRHRKFEMLEFEHRRIDTLLAAIHEIPEGQKIIIWAKFQYDIEHIRDVLKKEFGEDSVAVFHGKLSEKERARQVMLFRGPARFFLATQSAGGHGLTLNEAHYVIFYNNGFKYAEREQAEDRCHRIGQGHKVTYVDIECCCGIEERIAKALSNKGNVVEEFREEVERIKDKKDALKELIKKL